MDRPEKGFTLLELLIVVAIIGILAAVAIPTLMNAVDRGRQKRTMADLHTIATSIQAYATDINHCPIGSSVSTLATSLNGVYAQRIPVSDGWGHPYVYSGTALAGYTIGSAGKDGGDTLTLEGSGGTTSTLFADIIYTNGQFLQWPEGTQTN
jgi:general secretion pathway protein G